MSDDDPRQRRTDPVDPVALEEAIVDMEPAEALRATERLAGMDRQNAILANLRADEVVGLMHLEDLYFLVNEIGEGDALPLLELASTKQVEGIFDLEIWKKDRLDAGRAARWFRILARLEPEPFLRHLGSLDRALVLAFFKTYVRVHKRDETFDPIETPRLLFSTPDERYVVEYLKTPDQSQLAWEILGRVHETDLPLFYELMEGIYWETLSNCEEAAYEEKVRRLADHGFPDYYSALDILQFRDPGSVKLVPRDYGAVPAFDRDVPPPSYPVRLGARESLLSRTLERLDPETAADVQWDLAFVANRFIVATQADFGEVRQVRLSVERVHDVINLALERLCGDSAESAAAILTEYYVRELFLIGHSSIRALVRRARKLIQRLAERWGTRGEHLLETPYREFLEELAAQEPRLYLGVLAGGLTSSRPFVRYDDVRTAAHLLARLELLEKTFALLAGSDEGAALDLAGTNLTERAELRLAPLFCAGIARYALDGEFRLAPLAASRLAAFAGKAIVESAGPGGSAWSLDPAIAGAFRDSLEAVAAELGESAMASVMPLFDEMLAACAEELSEARRGGKIHPRFLRTILVALDG